MSEPAHTITIESADKAAEHPPSATASGGVCPFFHEAVELVGKRWTGAIVEVLIPGPRRFSEIAQAIPQISDRLLSTRLRELESEGIVEREVVEGSPIRVLYALSQKGRALEPAMTELRRWARHWLKPI
jgi:DNA-binding HxlR family transcriptional regulator